MTTSDKHNNEMIKRFKEISEKGINEVISKKNLTEKYKQYCI